MCVVHASIDIKMKTIFILVLFSYMVFKADAKTCKEFIKEASDKQVKELFACKKKLNYATVDERVEKMTCILKCTLTSLGFLTPDGYVDEATAIAYLEKEVPPDVQGKALQLMAPCQSLIGDVDPEEPKCLSYKPLIKCAMMVMFKVCND